MGVNRQVRHWCKTRITVHMVASMVCIEMLAWNPFIFPLVTAKSTNEWTQWTLRPRIVSCLRIAYSLTCTSASRRALQVHVSLNAISKMIIRWRHSVHKLALFIPRLGSSRDSVQVWFLSAAMKACIRYFSLLWNALRYAHFDQQNKRKQLRIQTVPQQHLHESPIWSALLSSGTTSSCSM